MKTEYTTCDGSLIKEGDIVMIIKPKRNKFGRYYCRAYHVVKAQTGLARRHALAVKNRNNAYEKIMPLPYPDSWLTIVGTVTEGVDHAKSKAMWDEAKRRTEEWDKEETA